MLAPQEPPRLRIGWSTMALMSVETDKEVARAVETTAKLLAEMGHEVTEESPQFSPTAMRSMADVWFFGLDLRLESYAQRTGRTIGPDTLEPVVLMVYEYAKSMKPAHLLNGLSALNAARRQLGQYFSKYDVWLSPTTPRVSEPWGQYNLSRTDVTLQEVAEKIFHPTCQFTLPHNITGSPAVSLPLQMHSSGLPIGVQLGGRPASEHRILQLASALEEALPWSERVPALHVSRA
jgi:amidase